MPPERIGPYAVLTHLGRGQTGDAFAARHVRTGRLATVKRHAPGEPMVAAWFGWEMQAAFLRAHEWGWHFDLEALDFYRWVARETAA